MYGSHGTRTAERPSLPPWKTTSHAPRNPNRRPTAAGTNCWSCWGFQGCGYAFNNNKHRFCNQCYLPWDKAQRPTDTTSKPKAPPATNSGIKANHTFAGVVQGLHKKAPGVLAPTGTATPPASGLDPDEAGTSMGEDLAGDETSTAQARPPQEPEETAEEVLIQAQTLDKNITKTHATVIEHYEHYKSLLAKKQEAKSLDSQLATKMHRIARLESRIVKKQGWATECKRVAEEKDAIFQSVCEELEKLEEDKVQLEVERAHILDLLHLQQHDGDTKQEVEECKPPPLDPKLLALDKLARDLPAILAHFDSLPGTDATLKLALHTATILCRAALDSGPTTPPTIPLLPSAATVTVGKGKSSLGEVDSDDEPDKDMPDSATVAAQAAKDKKDVSSHPGLPAGKKTCTGTGTEGTA